MKASANHTNYFGLHFFCDSGKTEDAGYQWYYGVGLYGNGCTYYFSMARIISSGAMYFSFFTAGVNYSCREVKVFSFRGARGNLH